MCGISGIIYISKKKVVTKEELTRLTNCIAHRGPDDQGIWLHQNVGLGHRRLSIIDLSKKGHQPMTDKNQRYWLTYNGEIYNFQEIKNLLLKKGYHFISNSDSEVIIYSYQEWGTKCLEKFRGMFAFAIYDIKENSLFAARDRLGKKPFKYFFDGQTFIFASEVKAIINHKEVTASLDEHAIKQYLYWGFVPSPKTGYKNIFKLPPASFLLLKNGNLQVSRYWKLKGKPDWNMSESNAIMTLRDLAEESVKLRMISDVPIGAFLSGGIDSAVIVGLMSKLSDKKINTYTIGFDGWSDNEAEPASITAKFHHTKHHQFIINPNIKKELPQILTCYDEPFGDSSAIPSYFVSKIASDHVTVVLNGDGGDENFFGYSNYQLFSLLQKLRIFSLPVGIAHRILRNLQPLFPNRETYHRLLRISHILSKSSKNSSYSMYARGYLNLIDFQDFFLKNPILPEKELSRYLSTNRLDADAILKLDLEVNLPDGLMTKMDIASMRWGLEARSPLLDHKLVEFSSTIPINLKYKDGKTKYIFRRAFNDLIPPQINKLPKRGFVMPLNHWIKNDLRTQIESELLNRQNPIYQMLSFETVKKILTISKSSKTDLSSIIWKIYVLSNWQKAYL